MPTKTIHPLITDGSTALDAHDPVEIDRDAAPWRYQCPNGHSSWDKTNSHIWCPECSRQSQQGEDVDPEHWEIVDALEDETIPWSAVILE